jgi:hypothetical protein
MGVGVNVDPKGVTVGEVPARNWGTATVVTVGFKPWIQQDVASLRYKTGKQEACQQCAA